MIIKPYEPTNSIARLEKLLAENPDKAKKIEREIKKYKAGEAVERQAAYHIDFELKSSRNYAVIHGLRLDHGSRVAQIDHLIINRTMDFFTVETKSFHSGFKITESGDFLRWNNFQKKYENMPSPLIQAERHHRVLREVYYDNFDLKRAFFKLRPRFHAIIAIDPKVRVIRPKEEVLDTSMVVTYERFFKYILKDRGFVSGVTSLSKAISSDTLMDIANRIASLHQPKDIDFSWI